MDQCRASSGPRTSSSLFSPRDAAFSAPILLSRSDRSVYRRNSSEAAASFFVTLGSSRRRARSDGFAGLGVEPDQRGEGVLVDPFLRLQHGHDVVEQAAQQFPLGRFEIAGDAFEPYLNALATFSLALA